MHTPETLKQIVSTLTALVMALQASIAGVPSSNNLAQVSPSATLSLSPSSSSITVGNTFTVGIIVNTGGQSSYGVDINKIHFNPSYLQVVDVDSGTSGVQIAPGSIMSLTIANSVDNTLGTVQFSQLASPGSTFSGSGTLATITFQAISPGNSNITFDFTSGSGTDSNVAGLGGDLLASVGSGSYTSSNPVDTTPPTAPGAPSANAVSATQVNLSWTSSSDAVGVTGYKVERCSGSSSCSGFSQIAAPSTNSYADTGLTASTIYRYRVRAYDVAGNNSSYSSITNVTTPAAPDTTAPSAPGTPSLTVASASQINLSWTASTDAVGVTGYKVERCSGYSSCSGFAQIATPTSNSYSDTGLTSGTIYTYRVRANDLAGNNSTYSSGASATTSIVPIQRTITIDPQAITGSKAFTVSLAILDNTGATLGEVNNINTNGLGQATITIPTGMPTTATLRVAVPGYLTQTLSGVDLSNISVLSITFPQVLAGDFNNDGIVNSLDFSVMNTAWLTSSATADINRDGVVNSLDFAYLSDNWLLTGQ